MNMKRDLLSCFVGNRLTGFSRVIALLALLLSGLAFAFSIIDVSGWWTDQKGGLLEIRQQQASITGYNLWGALEFWGHISNDTLFLSNGSDSGAFIYSQLDGTFTATDSQGGKHVLTRTTSPNWITLGCHTITVDGDTLDWAGIAPVADDPNDDATGNPSTEIDKIYVTRDQQYLYLRIDIVGPANPQHSGDGSDRYSFELRDQERDFEIGFWGDCYVRIKNFGTSEETFLGPCGMSGHMVEGRVPLALLGGMERAELEAESEYASSESGPTYFDEVSCLLNFGSCSLCGDFDGSGNVLIPDIVYFVNWLFAHGPAPFDGSDGDVNCDQRTNLADAVYLVNYVFLGGFEPCHFCK